MLPDRRSTLCVLLLSALLLAAPRVLLADGGVIGRELTAANAGRSSDQRAILIHDSQAGTETMLLSTRYVGDPADFAWVIPVPSLPGPGQVGTWPGGEAAFAELATRTAPRVTIYERTGGVGGCAGCTPWMAGGGAGAPSDTALLGVEVVERLQVAGMDIALLNAQSSADLAEWLTRNGYALPENATPVFDHYVQKRWGFIAVKMDVPEARAGRAAPVSAYFPQEPLRITFATDSLVFPIRISALSTRADGGTVLLYVIADHRVRAEGVPTLEMNRPSGAFATAAQFEATYEQAFNTVLHQSTTPPLVVEYAAPVLVGELPSPVRSLQPLGRSCFLTRLRTRFRPEEMTDDLTFVAADADTSFQIAAVGRPERPLAGSALALALAALTLVIRSRRGSKGDKRALAESLLVGMLALCALGSF